VRETRPLLGTNPPEHGTRQSRAKRSAAPPPPRPVPAPQLDREREAVRVLYMQAVADVAGAVGLYLHGAATLEHPSMSDIQNVRDVADSIRQFALGTVGLGTD
jgi:hypothetical protein